MSGGSDYLDRLKNIREKYGCSQPKIQSAYTDQLLNAERPTGLDRPLAYERPSSSTYYKADTFGMDKMKIVDPYIPSSTLTSKDYSVRPQSSIGTTQAYAGLSDYSRKADREREIDQIR